jgi:hypothetical protein
MLVGHRHIRDLTKPHKFAPPKAKVSRGRADLLWQLLTTKRSKPAHPLSAKTRQYSTDRIFTNFVCSNRLERYSVMLCRAVPDQLILQDGFKCCYDQHAIYLRAVSMSHVT